jgi:hypothetical protein
MDVTEYTVKDLVISTTILLQRVIGNIFKGSARKGALLPNLRQWFDSIEVKDQRQAHFICRVIPAQCPFARTIKLFDRTILTIPPLCKLNPLYNEFVVLRFRALSYLVEECGEDINFC